MAKTDSRFMFLCSKKIQEQALETPWPRVPAVVS
jgi:hypothetical protein